MQYFPFYLCLCFLIPANLHLKKKIIRGCIRCHRAKVMSLWQQDHQKKDCTRVCIGSV
ncbi:hypothetical protein C5167_044859 [Papaver somniferum]|nr:hypothetical protein C5167_044859 [Papaver somniferum]